MTDSATIKQLGRRRVFVFFFGFALVAIANTVTEENDILLHVVDDYADILIAVVALAITFIWWKRNSLSALRKLNNILAVFAVLLILATIFAITQEINDPTDFGNEIPTLFFGVAMLINRFV